MQTNALLPEGQVRDVLMSNQRMYTALVAGFNEETAITGLQGRDLLLQCIYASEDLGVPEMGLPLPIRDAIRDNTARLQQLGWRIDEVSGYDHMTLPPETIAERIIDFLKDKSGKRSLPGDEPFLDRIVGLAVKHGTAVHSTRDNYREFYAY